MPGILPMKVIKVGTSSQSRIAQACDRCRSKKIRCDGIRPCCSQCASVGFECKTSDKLSRRAFPRGYTESLEDRVRVLEGEVRELKDLLDEKDEKIDMLSKMHSNRRPSNSPTNSPSPINNKEESLPPKEDIFRVQASPLLLGSTTSDSFFMGPSSGRAFVDAFKRKIQENGKSCSGFNTEAFLNAQGESTIVTTNSIRAPTIPPRIFSDRCINVFWQEHAPLFPILHKPTFLRLYEEYVTNPEEMTDNHKLAQLHLVFSIAGFSSGQPDREQIALCDEAWRRSLNAIIMENTLSTLQCLVLACLYCNQKGAYKALQIYKAIAVGLSHRLGLHQSQKRFSFGALTMETRKKVFWSLYTVDCFSAASMGLPKLLKEADVETEYPLSIDDEYVTEKGFLPTLPGESSKISSALALFRASRTLSKTLEQNYPAAASYDLSLQSISALSEELDEWSDNLPTHLKLTFVQDKPSTDVTGNRSALLSLAYYYIRTLIHRPVIGSSLESKASSSIISVAESSKHIIQVIALLEERSMSFSFCLNKSEMLTLCGLSLLYQGLELKEEGKLMKDGQRLLKYLVRSLDKAEAPGAGDFKRLVATMSPVDGSAKPLIQRRSSDKDVSSLSKEPLPSPSVAHNLPTKLSPRYDMQKKANTQQAAPSNQACKSVRKQSVQKQSSADSIHATALLVKPRSSSNSNRPNLDYLSFTNTPAASAPPSPEVIRSANQYASHTQAHVPIFPSTNPANQLQSQPLPKASSVTPTEWENLLSSLDGGITNIYDAVYGGPSPSLSLKSPIPVTSTQTSSLAPPSISSFSDWDHDFSSDSWDMTALSMTDFDSYTGHGHTAQSVLSFSEESLSSGDDLGPSDFSGSYGQQGQNILGGCVLNDGFVLDGTFGI